MYIGNRNDRWINILVGRMIYQDKDEEAILSSIRLRRTAREQLQIAHACATGHPLTYFSGLKPSKASYSTSLAYILDVHDVVERGNEGGSAGRLVDWTILLNPQASRER
jgi:hypothetical protein